MYDLIRLYVMPIAFAILTVMDWMQGDDLLMACFVWGTIHLFVQLVLVMARDRYAEWCDYCRRMAQKQLEEEFGCTTRHRDITLDDLNALLERIDRGENGVPDQPMLTTNERRRLIGYAQRRSYAGDEVIVESVPVYSTSYADNVAYTVIPEPSAAVSGVTQNRR
ncbi:MAG: hypothetical protein IKE22_13485 [Atopobiaceae bacterium]|nr:hypothetical protein [Atopobiaceae bacterium]